MAMQEISTTLGRLLSRPSTLRIQPLVQGGRRAASTTSSATAAESSQVPVYEDLESQSSLAPSAPRSEDVASFDPVSRAAKRTKQLPKSRYQYRSPRYYRGPLHPHQPPPASDPASREFVPGPFTVPRLEQTYESTVAQDLMALTYSHKPPGTVKVQKAERLRTWDDSSPYHKNRPKRGPRGGDVLRLIEEDINWQNIPKITEVTVHSMIKGATEDSAYLHVAGLMLQSITGARPEVHRAAHTVAQFGIRKEMPISLTCTLKGEEAWQFIDKCVNLVLPKIKDWPGVKGTTGDSSGNLAFGIDKWSAQLFPEVEVNYDMYPPHMIPGFHVICKTTATSDRHARLLLKSLGLPFYGKYVD